MRCGAVGAVTGIGNALPKPVLRLIGLCEQAAAGNAAARRQAMELEEALHVLSKFDEGPDLVLFYKYLMVLEGNSEYELNFNESDHSARLAPRVRTATMATLQELVEHMAGSR